MIPYFSLASGFLTGKYRQESDLKGSPRAYRVKDMLNDRGKRILGALDQVARELQATPAQVSLAWLHCQGSHCADCQRHQRRAAQRADVRCDAAAQRRCREDS